MQEARNLEWAFFVYFGALSACRASRAGEGCLQPHNMAWWESPQQQQHAEQYFPKYKAKKEKHTVAEAGVHPAAKLALALCAGLLLLGVYHLWNIYAMCSAEIEASTAKDEYISLHAACREEFPMFAHRLDCIEILHNTDERTKRARITSCWWHYVNPFKSYWNIALALGTGCLLLQQGLSYRLNMVRNQRKRDHERQLLAALTNHAQRGDSPRRYVPYGQQAPHIVIEPAD